MSLDTFAHETNFRITFDFGLNSSDTINNKYYIIYNEINIFTNRILPSFTSFLLSIKISLNPLNVNSINPRALPATALLPFHFCHNTVERIDDRRLHESGGTRTKAGSLY